MSGNQDSKGTKSKKMLQAQDGFFLSTPDKRDNDFCKTINLRDLSPISPIYRTIKRSYDTSVVHWDLAMIETPLAISTRKSLIQEVEDRAIQISKLLVWEEEQQEKNNSNSFDCPQINSSFSQFQKRQQTVNRIIPANNTGLHIDHQQFQIPEKAGQQIAINKQFKKTKQKRKKVQKTEPSKRLTCNCKKTKCLKLYCDCFRENQVCGKDCNCVGCHNTNQYPEQRHNAMLNLIERNPEAFKPKLDAEQHAKGCNCKKSGCLKKYCQCYQAGFPCGQHCKCEQCKNNKTNNQQQNILQSQIILKQSVKEII